MKLLNVTVFPSTEKTMRVDEQLDGPDYGGVHSYNFQNSLGFDNNTEIGRASCRERV